ncbi:winged helix-turn-helix domain-containing protein [Natrinema versiforme]|nr:helix-turn-helix domain-containing protein [Natrinema versiforme]
MDPREIDAVFALLSNATRRSVLRYLVDAEETTARELARTLTMEAPDSDTRAIDDSRQVVATALVHNHLPRLDEYDIVEYDGTPDEVTPGPNFDAVEPFVEPLEEFDGESAD